MFRLQAGADACLTQRDRNKRSDQMFSVSLLPQIATRARCTLLRRRSSECVRRVLDRLRKFAGTSAARTMPMADALRQAFVVADPVVRSALDPLLLEHRSRI